MSQQKLGGFKRKVFSPRGSIWGVGKWAWDHYDPANWWMDAWHEDSFRYLHVEDKDKEDGRVYRLYPREHKGRRVTLSMKDGELYWAYGPTPEEMKAWLDASVEGQTS